MLVQTFISSLCVAMIGFSAWCLFFSLRIQFNHEYDENDPKERQLRSFVVGVTFMSLWALFQSTAYLAWDPQGLDLISKAAQYKIGLLGRAFGIVGLYKFFLTLSTSMRVRDRFLAAWAVFFITVVYYVLKVSI